MDTHEHGCADHEKIMDQTCPLSVDASIAGGVVFERHAASHCYGQCCGIVGYAATTSRTDDIGPNTRTFAWWEYGRLDSMDVGK